MNVNHNLPFNPPVEFMLTKFAMTRIWRTLRETTIMFPESRCFLYAVPNHLLILLAKDYPCRDIQKMVALVRGDGMLMPSYDCTENTMVEFAKNQLESVFRGLSSYSNADFQLYTDHMDILVPARGHARRFNPYITVSVAPLDVDVGPIVFELQQNENYNE